MSESRDFSVSRRSAVVGSVAACCGLAACGDGSSATKTEAVDVKVDKAKVDVGSGYVDSTNKIIVLQPKAGEYKAYSSVCPHQGCSVSGITETALVCPCHGSRFDPATGKVTAGPAQSDLPAKQVKVEGDKLHITG